MPNSLALSVGRRSSRRWPGPATNSLSALLGSTHATMPSTVRYYPAVATSSFQPQEIKSPAWARYYRRHGTSFARSAAPSIRSFYESTRDERADRSLLDVCCGQGTLAKHFLEHGYRVTGIDLSEPMLAVARENLREHLQAGRALLVRADAASFSVDARFGLATATFDSLNMLQSLAALQRCFGCVRRALLDDGMFVFDLMTRRGFWQDYNSVWVADTEDELYVLKSVYDGGDKAATRMTGFIRSEDGRWERFEELRTPTLFPAPVVVAALRQVGWTRVWAARIDDLTSPIADPEEYDRVWFVAMNP
jgi:SAM-dependent methyltransferase